MARKENQIRMGYRVSEVASLFGVSRQLIYKKIAAGELPAFALTPNLLIVRHRDLERLMQKRRA